MSYFLCFRNLIYDFGDLRLRKRFVLSFEDVSCFFIGRPVAIRALDAPNNQPSLAVSLPTRIYSPVKSRSLNNKTSPRKHRSYSESSEDTLFDLEGFQSSKNCEPFYESDEDSSGTDCWVIVFQIKPSYASGHFPYPMKTSENLWCFLMFSGGIERD